MVGIDFDSMTLEQMRDKLLEAKEILAHLNDVYHLDSCQYSNIQDYTSREAVFFNYGGFVIRADILPYGLGSTCLDCACGWIEDFIDVREDNLE